MRFPSRKLLSQSARVLFSIAVIGTLCALALPLPLGLSVRLNESGKDCSEPFPCQNRPCGCQSAEQCWKKCCCFTNTQKVAWAKANNVTVPEFVLVAARKEAATTRDQQQTVASCCSANPPSPKCATCERSSSCSQCVPGTGAGNSSAKCKAHRSAQASASHVTLKKSDSEPAKSTGNKASTKSRVQWKWVLAFSVSECHGMGAHWFCLPPTILPDPPRLLSQGDVISDSCVAASEKLRGETQEPPLPPPRVV